MYSQQTATFYGGGQAQTLVEGPTLGFHQALIEVRIPFEMVHDRLLDREDIASFRTLILPNIAALSDLQCQQIREFVEREGNIVATYETSLYDEWGVRREGFGLASILGASFAGKSQGPMLNSYLSVEKDAATRTYHPLLAGLEDATRIINAIHQVDVRAIGNGMHSPLQIIPSYPDLLMESVFPPETTIHNPGVFARVSGASRTVYFPGDIDRTFWEVLDADHAKLLRNAVLWATNEPTPVTVEGQGVLDISIWVQKDSMTVHLVNLTNPMMMKGPRAGNRANRQPARTYPDTCNTPGERGKVAGIWQAGHFPNGGGLHPARGSIDRRTRSHCPGFRDLIDCACDPGRPQILTDLTA